MKSGHQEIGSFWPLRREILVTTLCRTEHGKPRFEGFRRLGGVLQPPSQANYSTKGRLLLHYRYRLKF